MKGVSHRPGLSRQENRVLDHLENRFPDPHRAEEDGSEIAMDVRTS